MIQHVTDECRIGTNISTLSKSDMKEFCSIYIWNHWSGSPVHRTWMLKRLMDEPGTELSLASIISFAFAWSRSQHRRSDVIAGSPSRRTICTIRCDSNVHDIDISSREMFTIHFWLHRPASPEAPSAES